ncbi:hypothetical protein V1514DRAFT_84683 [Lipomyces japonicus]|uniref:uncharacterized protein n=1 Tax=Lipomyces japonicus TaxID=56871 RepID=UPI0034CFE5A0
MQPLHSSTARPGQASNDDTHHEYSNSTRKRVGKACDSCRIKKSKCDGRKPCSRCIMDDKICTFTERKKAKEKFYSSRYVELLESRIDILQHGMSELVRRVNRGDDVSCLLSKSGHISINRALEELTKKSLELQKEDHERMVVVHDHDESEHDTEHEHDHDHDHGSDGTSPIDVKMEEHVFDHTSLSVDTNLASSWTPVPLIVDQNSSLATTHNSNNDSNNLSLSVAAAADPETIIREAHSNNQGYNHASNYDSMSPSSMTSSSSSFYSSASPSPIDLQHYHIPLDVSSLDKDVSSVYDNTFDATAMAVNSEETDPMFGKAGGDLSDMWLNACFDEL